MIRRIPGFLIFSLLLIAVSASTVFSARKAPARRQYNPVIRAVVDYALDGDSYRIMTASRPKGDESPQASLGASSATASPGAQIGNTYWEYQANTFQGRMIRAGRNFDAGLNDSLTLIHFEWTNADSPDLTPAGDLGPAYGFYDASSAAYQSEVTWTFQPQYGRFYTMEVTKGNQAIVCGQLTEDGNTANYTPTTWYDNAPGDQGFGMKATIPDANWQWMNPYSGEGRNLRWAHVAFQQRPTGQHITHVFAQTWNGGGARHILYYNRKEGAAADSLHKGSLSSCPMLSVTGWDCPFVPDTAQSTVAGIEASKQSGKLALYWSANLPDVAGCDTCSANNDLGGVRSRYRCDMYYQPSTNYGVTWGNMVNVTKNDSLTADWTVWGDMDGLWDSSDKFHIVWVAADWKRYRTQNTLGFGARVFHWFEDFGPSTSNSNKARTVMQENVDPIMCNAGAFNMNLAKINIAQCNGNLYVTAVNLWDGHDDPAHPDCSRRGYDGDFSGAVNGEIQVAISDDNGTGWDLPHDLTNSPTPECDSVGGVVGPCASDHYPSMTPRGIVTRSGDDFSGATKVNPRPAQSYPDVTGAEWLDIQYINDIDAGTSLYDNSTIRNNPVRHFRMACVDPDQVPVPVYSISEINWPTYVKPGQNKQIPVIIENIGNAPTTMSVTPEEDTGPAGWLTVNGFAASIGEGLNNADTGNVKLDATGIPADKVNAAGGTTVVYGRVLFDHQGPSDVDTMPVTLVVTDTVRLPQFDTISTGVISLAVATNGQFGGGQDNAPKGDSRLDYFHDPAECDTVDSIPGDTRIYLYDGSFAVGGVVDTGAPGGAMDTVISNQIFSQGTRIPSSVYPLTNSTGPTTAGILQTWSSGKLTNNDTSLAFSVRWVVPRVTATYGSAANKTWYADRNFMTRELKIWPNDGAEHAGLAIGDAIDWDIPADSGSDNKGLVDATRRLLYQQGGEYNQDGAVECQDNSARYGGLAFGYLRAYWDHDASGATPKKWTVRDSAGYGGYIEANARYVYSGWDDNQLYVNMQAASGYIPWSHANPDSFQVDLHSVLTCAFDYDLKAGDTVVVYTVYASVLKDLAGPARIQQLADRGRNFTKYWTCCVGNKGDLNGDGSDANVLDLTFAVDRIFRGGGPATCFGEADVNNDKSPLDVLDLTFLVDRIFRAGAAPVACSTAPI